MQVLCKRVLTLPQLCPICDAKTCQCESERHVWGALDMPHIFRRNGSRDSGPTQTEQGLWGPQGSQAVPTVHTARLRTLFTSKAAILTARATMAGLLVVITWKSLAPAPDILDVTHADKVLHFVAYGAVAALAVLSRPFVRTGAVVLSAILLASGWGAMVEVVQGLMAAGREASWGDAAANTLGAVGGAVIAALLVRTPR